MKGFIVDIFTTIYEYRWNDTSCRLDLLFPHSYHFTCQWRITCPTYPLSSLFHKKINNLFLIHLTKYLLQVNVCTIKVIPLSPQIILIFPLLLINRLISVWIKLSVVKLLDKHINLASYLFWIFRHSLTKNVPNISMLQYVKGDSSKSLSAVRFSIFYWHIFLHSLLHSTHLDIIDLTAFVQLITQYPWLQISVFVIP